MIRLLIFVLMLSHVNYIYAEDKEEDKAENKKESQQEKEKEAKLKADNEVPQKFSDKEERAQVKFRFQVQPTTPLLALV